MTVAPFPAQKIFASAKKCTVFFLPLPERRCPDLAWVTMFLIHTGNHQSAGKRLSGKTRKGSQWLRTALVEAAHAATHCKDCYLAAQYHRLVPRRGKKKATIAVGHTLLVIVYHVLAEEKDYQELGGNFFDEHDRQAVQKRLVHRLEKLGYEVTLAPTSLAS